MVHTVTVLADQVQALRAAILDAENDSQNEIAACSPANREGAVNLIHYAALRRHDLRELQGDLMDIGVSSLATTEANVSAKLAAAEAALRALGGDPGPWDLEGLNEAIDAGDMRLARNADVLLGPLPQGRSTRIMVTLPSEAAADAQMVRALVERGMDVARINCAHDGPDVWAAMAKHVRAAAAEVGRTVLTYMDLGGPKLRTGPIAPGPSVVKVKPVRDALGAVVERGQMMLTDGAVASDDLVGVPVDPQWLRRRRLGQRVTFSDTRGRERVFEIVEVRPDGVVVAGDRTAYLMTGMKLRVGSDSTRVGALPAVERRLRLAADDVLILTRDLTPADPDAQPARIGCTLPEVFDAARVGHRVLFDDGEIEGLVEQVTPDEIRVRITRTQPGGKRLGAEKGVNLPDTDLPVAALTDADMAAVPCVVENADVVGLSFVRSPGDVEHMREVLVVHGGQHIGLVVKVETPQAVADLPAILMDLLRWPQVGVMIARGDLMTEIGWERMSEVPYQILSLCEAGHIPVIWATQVLESLAKKGMPSRAELIDAGEADRAECVMLNKGPHILETVETLDAVLRRMRRVQRKNRALLRQITSWS